jgi:hypothetical protein
MSIQEEVGSDGQEQTATLSWTEVLASAGLTDIRREAVILSLTGGSEGDGWATPDEFRTHMNDDPSNPVQVLEKVLGLAEAGKVARAVRQACSRRT